jgi:hypothetical protein
MKTNLIVLFLFLSVNILFTQTTNDFRSATSGNWNVTSSWERYNGTSWVAASGIPTSTNCKWSAKSVLISNINSTHSTLFFKIILSNQIIIDKKIIF